MRETPLKHGNEKNSENQKFLSVNLDEALNSSKYKL